MIKPEGGFGVKIVSLFDVTIQELGISCQMENVVLDIFSGFLQEQIAIVNMNHRLHIVIIWACCFLISIQVFAQRVCFVNAKNQALPLTHFFGCDEGAIADESGCINGFICDSIFITSVGYLDTIISNNETNSRTIVLKEQTYPLPIVNVSSQPKQIKKTGGSMKYYFGLKKPNVSTSGLSFPYIEIAQVFRLSDPCSEILVQSIEIESLQKLRVNASLAAYSISGSDTLALGPRLSLDLKLRRRKVARVDFDNLRFSIPENHSGKQIMVSLSFDTRQLSKDIRIKGYPGSQTLTGSEFLIALKSTSDEGEKVIIRYSAIDPFREVESSSTIFNLQGLCF